MTLATRCPSCGTTFRVVSDQLKLRKGLVKCGRCLTVFNGVEKLHYIADEAVKTQVTVAQPDAAEQAAAPADVDAPVVEAAPAEPVAAVEAEPVSVAPPPPAPAPVVPEPLRPDLPRFVPASVEPPAPAPSTLAFVEPDRSIDSPVEDEVRATTPRDATPWPQISTAMLDARRGSMAPAPTPSVPVAAAPVEAAADDGEAVMDPEVVDIEGFPVHDMGDIVFDDELSSDAPVAPTAAAPLDMPAAPTVAETRAANLRNIFEGDSAFDDLREVSVDAGGVLPQQLRSEELGPLTLLDVAGDRDVPLFLQEPRRASRGRRIATALACVIALLGLVAQAAYGYRAELAASYPISRPVLEALCSAVGPDCTIGLPRRISQLRVVSAELQAAPQSGDRRYLLRFGLGNDSARAQAWPNLELMLTDIKNQQVVRRVITPAEYLSAGRTAADSRTRIAQGLAPKADEALSIPVRVDLADPVYGYALGIFNP